MQRIGLIPGQGSSHMPRSNKAPCATNEAPRAHVLQHEDPARPTDKYINKFLKNHNAAFQERLLFCALTLAFHLGFQIS